MYPTCSLDVSSKEPYSAHSWLRMCRRSQQPLPPWRCGTRARSHVHRVLRAGGWVGGGGTMAGSGDCQTERPLKLFVKNGAVSLFSDTSPFGLCKFGTRPLGILRWHHAAPGSFDHEGSSKLKARKTCVCLFFIFLRMDDLGLAVGLSFCFCLLHKASSSSEHGMAPA